MQMDRKGQPMTLDRKYYVYESNLRNKPTTLKRLTVTADAAAQIDESGAKMLSFDEVKLVLTQAFNEAMSDLQVAADFVHLSVCPGKKDAEAALRELPASPPAWWEEGASITHMEIQAAVRAGKPVLTALRDDEMLRAAVAEEVRGSYTLNCIPISAAGF